MNSSCDPVLIAVSSSLGIPFDCLPLQGMRRYRRQSLVEALRQSIDMNSLHSQCGIFDIRQILDQFSGSVPGLLTTDNQSQSHDTTSSLRGTPSLPSQASIQPFKQRAASIRLHRRSKRSKSEPHSTTDSDEDYESCNISQLLLDSPSNWNRRSLNSTSSSMTNSSTASSSSSTTVAEAVSDHVAVLSDELPFAKGDSISLIDTSSPSGLWFGSCRDSQGWFPASYVKVVDGEENGLIEEREEICDDFPEEKRRQRARGIEELLKTERDYVQLLDNIVHGFLDQTVRRSDLFSKETVDSIFSNISQLLQLHIRLLRQLEVAFVPSSPEDSLIGASFLRHKHQFSVYAPYCNNRPVSSSTLAHLSRQPIYTQFFDACRLLRGMPRLSLEAFLLTPVQRICRYPLQLQQIYKVTPSGHADRHPLSCAIRAMKEVASQLDERRRRIEALQAIAVWQASLQSWKGPDLLEKNSQLMKSGEVMCRCVSNGQHWSKQISLFLFDQTLVLCKKDLFSRNSYLFKERISLSTVSLHDVPDGKDATFHVTVKNSFRLIGENRHFLFTCLDSKTKSEWLEAFSNRSRIFPPATAEEKKLALATLKCLRYEV